MPSTADTTRTDQPADNPAPVPDFEAFFASQHAPLARLAYALTGSRQDAQDLSQEALLRAFKNWETVSAHDSPGTWTRRVLINLVYSRTRRRQTEASGLRRLLPIKSRRDPTELSDSAAAFWDAVRMLPPRQAQAVALRYGADLPAVEVAEILELDPGTVRAHLHAARKRLSEVLEVEAEARPQQLNDQNQADPSIELLESRIPTEGRDGLGTKGVQP